jgi:hypothetical protein
MITSVEQSVKWVAGETEQLGENLPPVELCAPQLQLYLIWAQSRAAEVGSRPLTAWAVARPKN